VNRSQPAETLLLCKRFALEPIREVLESDESDVIH
jgi:hypothetical protein